MAATRLVDGVRPRPGLPTRTLSALRSLNRLGRSEAALVGVMLLIYAVLRPYGGFAHDARLYELQVLNRVTEGRYDGDLFLVYGSQDSFSAFSAVMTPLARVVGVKAAFLGGYLVALVLLLWGEVRLVKRLVSGTTCANLALLLLAISHLTYGWGSIFNVHEKFLTARLPAEAFALWGLAMALDRRWLAAFALSFLGAAFHPLMCAAPLCVVVGLFVVQSVSARNVLILSVGAFVVAAVAISSPLALRWLTVMDAPWLEMVRLRSPHCVLSAWSFADGIRVLFPMAILCLRWRFASGEHRKRIVLILTAVAGGLLANAFGELRGFALLLQGQGFRGLWLLNVLAVPIGLEVVREYGKRRSLGGLAVSMFILAGLGQPLFLDRFGSQLVPIAMIWWGLFGLGAWIVLRVRQSPAEQRPATAAFLGLAVTLFFISARLLVTLLSTTLSQATVSPIGVILVILNAPSELLLWIACIAVIARVGDRRLTSPQFGWVTAACGVLLILGLVMHSESAAWRNRYFQGFSDLAQVQQFVDPDASPTPQIYWPVEPHLIWNELGANSYFHQVQTAGIIFSARTAAEGRRRGDLVEPFEVANMRRLDLNPFAWEVPKRVFSTNLDAPPPTEDDLLRLAADPQLDWIVLQDEFPGLYTATNGSIWIYDCRELRRRQGISETRGEMHTAGQNAPRRDR